MVNESAELFDLAVQSTALDNSGETQQLQPQARDTNANLQRSPGELPLLRC